MSTSEELNNLLLSLPPYVRKDMEDCIEFIMQHVEIDLFTGKCVESGLTVNELKLALVKDAKRTVAESIK